MNDISSFIFSPEHIKRSFYFYNTDKRNIHYFCLPYELQDDIKNNFISRGILFTSFPDGIELELNIPSSHLHIKITFQKKYELWEKAFHILELFKNKNYNNLKKVVEILES